ncbi:MAG: hypothetical protein ACI9CE_002273 [Flavobacterium sp.]|jgi:hypothetical protein
MIKALRHNFITRASPETMSFGQGVLSYFYHKRLNLLCNKTIVKHIFPYLDENEALQKHVEPFL